MESRRLRLCNALAVMLLEEIRQLAETWTSTYNPEGLSPFPFENILREKNDLQILLSQDVPTNVSGGISFSQEKNMFIILINNGKPQTRQQFTIAHELGHYALHQQHIRDETFVDHENVLDSAGMLYRRDEAVSTKLEIEANNFAASLIMPESLVRKGWETLNSVEECAEVFHVSIEAMSIRLSRLGLV